MPFRRNLFILGAGFSADAGAPVMHDFISHANILLRDPRCGLPSEQRDVFNSVFDFLHELRAAQVRVDLDLENIEHLFGVAEMYLSFSGYKRLGFRDSLLGLILQTLERTIKLPSTRSSRIIVKGPTGTVGADIEAHYGLLFAGIASRRWFKEFVATPDGERMDTIITLNYDCFLDDCLIDLGIRPDYHLPEGAIPASWKSLQSSIPLLKLHGSTNWLRCMSDVCHGRLWVSQAKSDERREYLSGRTQCPICSATQVEPVIVPPTWAKNEYREAITPVWTQAVRALEAAGRIFIIGYSLPATDTFFRYLLTLGLYKNMDLESVCVVNPNDATIHTFRELFPEPFRGRKIKRYPLRAEEFVARDLLRALGRESDLDRARIEESGITVS